MYYTFVSKFSFTKPALLFTCVVSLSHYHIKSIESVQKKFIRYLSFKTNTPMDIFDHNFHLMSTRFNLPTIQSIHRYNDMLLVWRILNGAIDKEDHQSVFVKRVTKYNLS